MLRSLCKHDEEMSTIVANSGGLEALILCLEDFEPMVCKNKMLIYDIRFLISL